MSGPSSRRGAQAQPAPEAEERRESEAPIRLRYAGAEIAVKGAQAAYMIGLAAIVGMTAPRVSTWLESIEKATASLDAVSSTMREVAAEVHAARQGVDRLGQGQEAIERRLGAIEGDVGALRGELHAVCGPRR